MTESKKKWITVIVACIYSAYIVTYMRIRFNSFIWGVVSLCLFMVFTKKSNYTNKWEKFWNLIFAGILSITLIMGYHIVISQRAGAIYNGVKTENYITPYGFNDFVALIVLTHSGYFLLNELIHKLTKISLDNKFIGKERNIEKKNHTYRIMMFLLLAWLPYFLCYYPGFIFGDSLNAIKQAIGVLRLHNNQPIMYTMLLKLCLWLGQRLYNITFGCAIYTIIQMFYLAFGLGYFVNWTQKRGLSYELGIIETLIFAFVPFFAQHSIAMWKDPIFSISVTLWSLMLFDFSITEGKILDEKGYTIKSVILLLLICFSRNNGIYTVIFCELFFLLVALLKRKEPVSRKIKKMMLNTGGVLIAALIITGPIYNKLGVSGTPAVGLGVFLNQTARVAAYDGEMSENDKEFMNNVLPIEKYAEIYRPCVVDLLKWDPEFDQTYLGEHKDEFWKVYFSMFSKNPHCYIQAWEMTTFGYWALNQWELNFYMNNISAGDVNAVKNESFGIEPKNLLSNKYFDFTKIFSIYDKPIALAIVNWFILFVALLILIKKIWIWGIALAPSLGILATLLIGTPHAYWQRYGLSQYYLIPMYALMLLFILRENKKLE